MPRSTFRGAAVAPARRAARHEAAGSSRRHPAAALGGRSTGRSTGRVRAAPGHGRTAPRPGDPGEDRCGHRSTPGRPKVTLAPASSVSRHKAATIGGSLELPAAKIALSGGGRDFGNRESYRRPALENAPRHRHPQAADGRRRCAGCGETLPLASFRRDSRGYWRSNCNDCALLVTREWKARNRETLLARRRAAPRAHPCPSRPAGDKPQVIGPGQSSPEPPIRSRSKPPQVR